MNKKFAKKLSIRRSQTTFDNGLTHDEIWTISKEARGDLDKSIPFHLKTRQITHLPDEVNAPTTLKVMVRKKSLLGHSHDWKILWITPDYEDYEFVKLLLQSDYNYMIIAAVDMGEFHNYRRVIPNKTIFTEPGDITTKAREIARSAWTKNYRYAVNISANYVDLKGNVRTPEGEMIEDGKLNPDVYFVGQI